MSSNCDSDGCPIDHDGNKLEDGGIQSGAPFAVRGDIFHEIFSGSGQDKSTSHLDANPLGGFRIKPSSLDGGIPFVENVTVEDYYSSDEPLSPKSAVKLCKNETSDTIHAMLRTSKHEREALLAARRKLADTLKFLRSKGFTEEQVIAAQGKDGMGMGIPSRDDFGLPLPHSGSSKSSKNPFVDKMKEKAVSVDADTDILPQPNSDAAKPKLWSQVVKEAPSTSPSPCLSYFPPPEGDTVLAPPDEALRKGIERLKFTVMGSFSKGIVPFLRVQEFANSIWKNRGLVHVGQKDNRTFLFKFDSNVAMNNALARGTWYIDRKPMIVHSWGMNVNSVKKMPLWVRFDNVPDSYWTPECLSRLASVVGPPICADALTSNFEVLPFAKICVKYTVGNDLPTTIPVTVLNPSSGCKSVENVLVSYPNKPLCCTACKALGHLVGACPTATRIWVKKSVPENRSPPVAANVEDVPIKSVTSEVPVVIPRNSNLATPAKNGIPVAEDLSDLSATPLQTFQNLRQVDEIDMKNATQATGSDGFQLSKSKRKRLKKSKGKSPSTLS